MAPGQEWGRRGSVSRLSITNVGYWQAASKHLQLAVSLSVAGNFSHISYETPHFPTNIKTG